MNFYKRHIGDYLKATAHLSLLEHGIYARLMDVYYTRESAIPGDQAARLIGARSKEELAAMNAVLREFFIETECGDWVQPRCEREIEAASSKADKNREVGKLGGRPRKNETVMVQDRNHDGFENEPTRNPSQTPDSRHQKEIPPHPPAGGGFARFWSEWPAHKRKVGKAQCEAKWRTRGCEAIADRVIEAVKALKGSPDWLKDDGEFIPAPLVWLNQSRWEGVESAPAPRPVEVWKPPPPMTAEERAAADAARVKAMSAFKLMKGAA